MTPKPRKKDGRLDPDWLGNAGLRFVRPWLRNRLEGRDPYQPVDHRYDEDPDAFVATLLRDVGSEHPLFEAISRSALDLLDDARKTSPTRPEYLASLLHLTQLVALPMTRSWFIEEIAHLAEKRSRWEDETTTADVLRAALRQGAGLKEHWEILLREPAFTTFALLALGRTLELRVSYIAEWWQVVERREGRRELKYFISSTLRDREEADVRRILGASGHSFPRDLREEIDARLVAEGRHAIFDRPRKLNPIDHACYRIPPGADDHAQAA